MLYDYELCHQESRVYYLKQVFTEWSNNSGDVQSCCYSSLVIVQLWHYELSYEQGSIVSYPDSQILLVDNNKKLLQFFIMMWGRCNV